MGVVHTLQFRDVVDDDDANPQNISRRQIRAYIRTAVPSALCEYILYANLYLLFSALRAKATISIYLFTDRIYTLSLSRDAALFALFFLPNLPFFANLL